MALSELDDILAENKRLRASIKGYKGLLGAREAPGGAWEPPASTVMNWSEPAGSHVKDPRVHHVKPWQPFCTEKGCGAPNEEFKDEVECSEDEGGCGRSLGAISTVSSIEACPSCSSRGTAKVKLREYAACADCSRPISSSREEAERLESCPHCHGHGLEWITA